MRRSDMAAHPRCVIKFFILLVQNASSRAVESKGSPQKTKAFLRSFYNNIFQQVLKNIFAFGRRYWFYYSFYTKINKMNFVLS